MLNISFVKQNENKKNGMIANETSLSFTSLRTELLNISIKIHNILKGPNEFR